MVHSFAGYQVFNLIMEQDAAFYDRMKTGSLMTILSTNVGSTKYFCT